MDGAGGRDARTQSAVSPCPRLARPRADAPATCRSRPIRSSAGTTTWRGSKARPRPLAARHPRGPGRRGEDPAGRSSSHGEQGRERWFVDLSRVSEGEAVAAAFLDTLGVSPRTGVADGDRIVETLDVRSMLLVVDNCEHVLGATAQIVDRIAACRAGRPRAGHEPAGARRRRRAGPGRRAAGSAAGGGDPRGAGRGGRGPHVHATVPSGPGRPSTTSTPSWRCAAGSTASRSPWSWPPPASGRSRRRRSSSSSTPAGRCPRPGPAARPERQVSLADAIDWSFRLLGEDERSILLSLSTFSGAFDVAAASAVAGTDVMTTADRLLQLVDQSLVQSVPGRAGRRFRLLETCARSRRAGSTRTWRPPPVTATPRTSPPGSTSSASGCPGRTRTTRSVSSASSSTTCTPPSTTPPPRETSTPRPASPTGPACPCRSRAPAGRTWPDGPARCLASRSTPCGSPSWPARPGARCWWPTSAGPESSPPRAPSWPAIGPVTCASAGSRPRRPGAPSPREPTPA